MSPNTSLEDRTCLVTGGSRGIGAATAITLGQAGAEVAVNYKSSLESAEQTVETINETGGSAIPVQANVAELEEIQAMADEVHDAFGTLDILVNNAGITKDTRFDRMSDADWHNVIDVNLHGTFYCTRAFYEDLIGSDYGRLINVSSIVGLQGNYGQANYAATKAALIGFTRTLSREMGRYGSTANCVAPGFTMTDMLKVVDEEIQEKIKQKITLGRFATPEEVAGVISFLAGPDASFVTGEVINVNGGMSI